MSIPNNFDPVTLVQLCVKHPFEGQVVLARLRRWLECRLAPLAEIPVVKMDLFLHATISTCLSMAKQIEAASDWQERGEYLNDFVRRLLDEIPLFWKRSAGSPSQAEMEQIGESFYAEAQDLFQSALRVDIVHLASILAVASSRRIADDTTAAFSMDPFNPFEDILGVFRALFESHPQKVGKAWLHSKAFMELEQFGALASSSIFNILDARNKWVDDDFRRTFQLAREAFSAACESSILQVHVFAWIMAVGENPPYGHAQESRLDVREILQRGPDNFAALGVDYPFSENLLSHWESAQKRTLTLRGDHVVLRSPGSPGGEVLLELDIYFVETYQDVIAAGMADLAFNTSFLEHQNAAGAFDADWEHIRRHIPGFDEMQRDGMLGREPPSVADAVSTAINPPDRHWLVVATEWNTKFGGISSFNRLLCTALAGAGERVVCYVPQATEAEIGKAHLLKISLVAAPSETGTEPSTLLRRRPSLPSGFAPTVIIGHGRITGPAARSLAEDHFPAARRLHVVHMASDEIEWYKTEREDDPAARAEERRRVEVDLGTSAHALIAVGPRLYARFLGDAPAARVVRFDPGIRIEQSLFVPPKGLVRILVFGRMEDVGLKRPDLAAMAVGRACSMGHRLELIVRGAPQGESAALRAYLRRLPGCSELSILVRNYTVDEELLAADLAAATVVLMPSSAEGFGLVGLEAIEVGVPVLVSDHSGLGEFIREVDSEGASRFVVPVTGNDAVDVEAWAQSISRLVSNPDDAFGRAASLRSQLHQAASWSRAVQVLISALGSSATQHP